MRGLRGGADRRGYPPPGGRRLLPGGLAILGRGAAVALVGSALVGAIACAPSVPPDVPLEAFTAHLDQRVPALLEGHGIPGANLAIVRDGAVAEVRSYGEADREEGRAMERGTLVRAESITKPVTAWAVMRLVEDGLLDLDDPVPEHLTPWAFPSNAFPPGSVTARRLLSHSAGLPAGVYDEYGTDDHLPSLEEALAGQAGAPPAIPVHEPGSRFTYSNQGYGVLELLVEGVSGRDYGEYAEEAILRPLGMEGASLGWRPRLEPALATGYDGAGSPIPDHRGPLRAHGELHATAEDIARLFAAGMRGPEGEPPGRGVLSPEAVAELHTPVVATRGFYALGSDAAGLGHFVDELPDGRLGVFHGGEGAGFVHMAYAIPEAAEAIVIVTNSKRGWPFLAKVLGDWARWQGVGSVATSRAFAWAERALWAVVALATLASLGLAWRLATGVRRGRLQVARSPSRARWSRVLAVGGAIAVVGVWWVFLRDVVTWLLPGPGVYLAGALWALAAALLLTALAPVEPRERPAFSRERG